MSMTNNDEMALKLKAAARKAVPGPWGIARDGITVVSNQSHPVAKVSNAEHRMLSDLITGMDAEFIATANPANILALLAERDADKKRIEMLEKYVDERDAQNQDLLLNIGSLQQRIVELREYYEGVIADGSKRIAELEARTVSVKLPGNCEHDVIAPVCSFMYESGFEIDTADYNALVARVRSEVETVMRRTFRAAGINLEVGEQS